MEQIRENQIIVQKIILENYDRSKAVDLTPIMIDFSFSENLFSSHSKGIIRVFDHAGLRTLLPLIGDEHITFFLRQPYTDDIVSYSFIVDSIKNVSKEDLNGEAFMLSFIAPAFADGLLLSHSMSFKNAKVTDILKSTVGQTHNIKNTDTTNGNINFIIPNYTSNELIRVLKRLALNDQNVSDFVFYGTLENEYNFRSVSKLYEEDVKHFLFYRNKNVKLSNKGTVLETQVKGEEFISQRKNSEFIANGSLGSELYLFDRQKKHFEKKHFSFHEQKNDFQQVNSGKRFWNDDWLEYISQSSNTKYSIQQGQKDFIELSKKTRFSQSFLLNNIVAKLILVGNLNYRVGETIYYDRPSVSPENNPDGKTYDAQYAGRYLITSVLHSVDNKGNYDTVIQISTDSFLE